LCWSCSFNGRNVSIYCISVLRIPRTDSIHIFALNIVHAWKYFAMPCYHLACPFLAWSFDLWVIHLVPLTLDVILNYFTRCICKVECTWRIELHNIQIDTDVHHLEQQHWWYKVEIDQKHRTGNVIHKSLWCVKSDRWQ
jgi:hypothetical protein